MNARHVSRLVVICGIAHIGFVHAEDPAIAKSVPAAPVSYVESSAATRVVSERYFAAYVDKRWDDLELLLADDAQFIDPTAESVFGKVEMAGKRAVMKNFRANYANLKLRFTPVRVIHSGDYSVFEGELSWSMTLPKRTLHIDRMPLVTVLRVEGGQVVEHQDFADYLPFLDAERATRP